MSRLYNKHIDQAVRTIDSVQPTTGFKKTEEFKKKLKIKKLEKELGKKPTTQKFNKGGRVGLKSGTSKKKKLNQGDILGNRFDKKFKKLALSKEAQLHAKDYDAGLDRAEKRAAKEVAQEAGLPMAKGGRVGLKLGTNLISRKKSNIQKIQETFGPKKKVPNKFKGFSKLPEKVQQKIDAKLAKKV